MSFPLLRVHLSAGFGAETILREIEFELEAGERLGLVGTSGAGKSTLVLALLGLLPLRRGWARGEVVFNGENLLTLNERSARQLRGRRIALVPQSPMSALNSVLSLRLHFQEAWRAHVDGDWPKFEARVGELMEQVQLPTDAAFLARKPSEISVGQAQRAALALALLHRPALLIADEPTSSLDPVTQKEILELLRQANRVDGIALLYISHDLLSVLQLCQRIAVLDAGRLVECISVEGIAEQARHPATLALLETLPAPAAVLRQYTKNF